MNVEIGEWKWIGSERGEAGVFSGGNRVATLVRRSLGEVRESHPEGRQYGYVYSDAEEWFVKVAGESYSVSECASAEEVGRLVGHVLG